VRRTPDGGYVCEAGNTHHLLWKSCQRRATWLVHGCRPDQPGAVVCDEHKRQHGLYVQLPAPTGEEPRDGE